MSRQVIFISHIHEEAAIAVALKGLIESDFECEVFVASAPGDLRLGRRWLDQITDALRTCVLEIVIVSPASVNRRWINFEAGAGWVRDIPVVPLCHSMMLLTDLPVPFDALQGGLATEVSILDELWRDIGRSLGQRAHPCDFSVFIETVKEVESRVRLADHIPAESPMVELPELSVFEKLILAKIACVLPPENGISLQQLSNSLPNRGSSEGKLNLALRKFGKLELVTSFEATDYRYEMYSAVKLTEAGWALIEDHPTILDCLDDGDSSPDRKQVTDYGNDIPF